MKNIRIGVAGLLAVLLSGCGTMMTTSDYGISKVQTESYARTTKCRSIPRVYSGVAYDACNTLLGETTGTLSTQQWLIVPYFIDGIASLLGDTLLLPYSIYMQADAGSLPVGGHHF